uniref:N-acetyltransferase domain-containing protein n=1 Tax=Anopheles farauti TaxID=69004 RepID=A0A182QI03_9DIPT
MPIVWCYQLIRSSKCTQSSLNLLYIDIAFEDEPNVQTMENTDRLCVIPPADWTELRDLYRRNWPEHHVAYTTIDNFVRWYEKDGGIKNLTIFCLNGSWREDGTYLVVDRYQLFVYSLERENCVLEKALHLLDWSGGLKVSSLLARHRQPVINVITAKSLSKEYDSETYLYYMPKDECVALRLIVPEGFELRSLAPKDVRQANDVWPNKHTGSLFLLQRLAAWNPNVGLYEQSSGKLVAWCFRLQAGALGALQVDEDYKRRGFGTVVTIALAKQIAALGHDCYGLVNAANTPSKQMFERVGFKHDGEAYWLRTIPTFAAYFAMPMDDSDQLVEILHPDWVELRDLYRKDWPKHEFAFYLLENYVRWKAHHSEVVKCYSLNGNWRADETFVLKFEKLQLKNLDHIYHQWPLRDHISYEAGYGLLKRLILLNESVGLFNEKDLLVSWCLSDQTGAHSDLQTMSSYCRNGYGRMVVIELAKRLARAGSDSKAYVLQENENSVRLFESVGFQKIQNLHWTVVHKQR